MARYIDADKINAKLTDEYHGMISDESMKIYEIIRMLDDAPTADVQKVRHGQWLPFQVMDFSPVPKTVALSCSLCQDIIFGEKLPAYCPSCGAKMDAKQQENNK